MTNKNKSTKSLLDLIKFYIDYGYNHSFELADLWNIEQWGLADDGRLVIVDVGYSNHCHIQIIIKEYQLNMMSSHLHLVLNHIHLEDIYYRKLDLHLAIQLNANSIQNLNIFYQ